ncbi:protocadherin beta-11-like isoform X1 [Saccostrea cucullata]|uniref:protocadherin beta-11-like isoform X1 n=1 Tax=Saccostrea cuccullata TaxID=36930 RepID=UPI002ED35DAA
MMGQGIRQLFLLLALDIYTQVTVGQEISLKYDLLEQQSRETFVGNVAVDSLLKANVTQDELDRMKFQILTQSSKDASYFMIHEKSSTIKTASVLDREVLCEFEVQCVLEFSVAVYKQDPQHSNQLDLFKIFAIKVNILDANDNAPTFPQSQVTLNVQESVPVDFVLLTSGAVDPDMGVNNSIQSYTLIPSNEMFGLKEIKNIDGSTDLGLVVRYKLDRETLDFYQVEIVAKDGGFPQRSGTVLVNITVIDDNDNPPTFSQAKYDAAVPENHPVGKSVLTLSAQDLDINENGEFTFSFNSRVPQKIKDKFAVNETSGEIYTISDIDFEEEENYQFLVEVKDKGREPKSSTSIVNISVLDVNDNAPQINVNLLPEGTDILESAEVGRYVANFAVSDLDSGANGKIQCQVLGEFFKIEEIFTNMYKVTIKSPLDYESKHRHDVTIQCQDQGIPQHQNTSSFVINVLDVNDNNPVFLQSIYRATIMENNPPNEVITTVEAVDKDSNLAGKVTYFMHTDGSDNFQVHPTSGVVTVKKSLDREINPVILFHVNASDAGNPQLKSSTLIRLTLEDENDNTPKFKKSHFEFYVIEEQKNLPTVGRLFAEDPDAGPNGQFSFDFASPRYPEFILDYDTGLLKAGMLDRELKTVYNFNVTVTDKGNPPRSSLALVTVHVLDANDNMPRIIYPDNHNNTIQVMYTTPKDSVIARVKADDIDEGNNSVLSFYIHRVEPSKPDLFKMNAATGELIIAKTMHLYDSDSYRLVLGVKNGVFTMYANLNVIITISNNTVLGPQSEGSGESNIIIVIAIVVVTVILSVAIIAAICIVRYVDRHRQIQKKSKETQIDLKKQESLTTESSQFTEIKSRNKKEVSFSLSDDDSMNISSLTNITSFSSYLKNPHSAYSVDGKLTEGPQACSSILTNNTLHSDLSKDNLTEKNLNTLYHQQVQSPWLQQLQEKPRRGDPMLRKSEDDDSEMSAESATSDSGRGGSEDDINSNRGNPMSDSEETRQAYTNEYPQPEQSQTPNKHTNVLHSSYRKPLPTSENYHRNISFSDDSVTANTTVDSAKNRHGRSSHDTHNQTTLSRILCMSSDRGLSFINGHTHLDTLDEATHSTFGLRYSLQDIDDTVSESVLTRDDDGNSTTTSGSYTINPDELVHEIDNLFFKSDVIV